MKKGKVTREHWVLHWDTAWFDAAKHNTLMGKLEYLRDEAKYLRSKPYFYSDIRIVHHTFRRKTK